jgi:hypothetical protein
MSTTPTRPGGRRLERLDQRVVPALQRAARGGVSFLAAPLRLVHRLEDRLAGGRPARFLYRHRQLIVLLAAVTAFAGSYVHLQRYPGVRAAVEAPAAGGVAPGGAERSAGPAEGAATVGPGRGIDLGRYVQERREALAAAEPGQQRLAVVSFDRLLTGEDAAGRLPEGADPLAAQLRVPVDDQDPFTVEVGDGDLVPAVRRAVARERERAGEEEREFRRLLESGTIEDEGFAEEYRLQADRLATVRDVLDAGSGTVFAVVVRAPVDRLQRLASADGVRLVDLAPPGVDPAASTFYGIRPDDRRRASYGAAG